jgi:hypothetical protein
MVLLVNTESVSVENRTVIASDLRVAIAHYLMHPVWHGCFAYPNASQAVRRWLVSLKTYFRDRRTALA